MLTEINIQDFIEKKARYDLIIDARSPKEFEHSIIPGAYNYYALSNEEHAHVGHVYKNDSRPYGKILGASYICANTARHIKNIYKDFPLGSFIAIYCARGGLRSKSIALILSEAGYVVDKIQMGYKEYRAYVLKYLESFPHKNFIALGGNTGCGKTELLQNLSPSIDIEGLANHLGSSFGAIKGDQPSQKKFQNTLSQHLLDIGQNSWVFVEAESKKLGNIVLPSLFYKRIHEGIRVEVVAPLEQRVQRILKDYQSVDEAFFMKRMEMIRPYIKKSIREEVLKAFGQGDLAKVSELLLVEYYDKVYKKPDKIDFIVDTGDFDRALLKLKEIRNEANTSFLA